MTSKTLATETLHARQSIERNKGRKVTARDAGWFAPKGGFPANPLEGSVWPSKPDSERNPPALPPTPPVRVQGTKERATGVREDRPETHSDAATWDRIKEHALRSGLGYRCACQLAYGIQHGFYAVEPPCQACAEKMAAWPIEKANGWRVPKGSAHHKGTWKALYGPLNRTACVPPVPATPKPPVRVETCSCCDIDLSVLYPSHGSPLWDMSEDGARAAGVIKELA